MRRSLLRALLPLVLVAADRGADIRGYITDRPIVYVDPIELPLFEGGTISGRMRVRLALQASDSNGALRLYQQRPEARSALLIALIDFDRAECGPLAPINAERMSGVLNRAMQRTGMSDARQVLILEVTSEPI
ncbi:MULTISPECIES: hypothetical protein [unclassified Sphingomonas]|uniref:hypothetical protein n=1 Tax=unclassified Sphingomonas TaxID=196159 RepID=UPI001611B921|nr:MULTISPECIES: hypothetical protein [unclassified Sphingomonas]MBB3346288.1 hypothetical protein [Sphingomonas sp. BK069]MBB3473401.1 hypothetical protein [Sphingomonas sp. BK345]